VIDVVEEINAVVREVDGAGADTRTVIIRRAYDTTVEDLWDACTNPERIPRWFLPVSGELRVGGRYQLEGNAGGTIESCDPPHAFKATWVFGDSVTWIEMRLAASDDGGTHFELRHTVPVDDQWSEYGPGAVGVGWDLGLRGLALHLASGAAVDAAAYMAWTASDEGRRFARLSSEGWRDASIAGGATPDEANAMGDRTTAAYTGG
jgi:uncharacterized protein YndB with AHSA1/START domain